MQRRTRKRRLRSFPNFSQNSLRDSRSSISLKSRDRCSSYSGRYGKLQRYSGQVRGMLRLAFIRYLRHDSSLELNASRATYRRLHYVRFRWYA